MLKRILNRRANHDLEPIDLKGIERLPANKAWYKSANATRLINLAFVGDLLRKIEKKDSMAFFSLYANHIDEYSALWGKPSFTYKNEYAWNAWVLKLSADENLILFSSKGGGSSFEVSGPGCNQWPPTLTDEAKDRLSRIILTLNHEVAEPKRRKIQATIAEPKKTSNQTDLSNPQL